MHSYLIFRKLISLHYIYRKIHILGSFSNIKIARTAICNLILGKYFFVYWQIKKRQTINKAKGERKREIVISMYNVCDEMLVFLLMKKKFLSSKMKSKWFIFIEVFNKTQTFNTIWNINCFRVLNWISRVFLLHVYVFVTINPFSIYFGNFFHNYTRMSGKHQLSEIIYHLSFFICHPKKKSHSKLN